MFRLLRFQAVVDSQLQGFSVWADQLFEGLMCVGLRQLKFRGGCYLVSFLELGYVGFQEQKVFGF